MTIDEAIEKLKKDAEIKRTITCNYTFECQLAEWLKELKELRECKCKYFNVEHKECSISNNTYEDCYNKAIDDCLEEISLLVSYYEQSCEEYHFTNWIEKDIKQLLDDIEQLKGEKNDRLDK